MARVGVFICHCGENISRTVDCEQVAEVLRSHPGVVHSVDYKYMCSDPGQSLVQAAITTHGLDAVVVGACSPHMHERTFRRAAAAAGLNPYRVEMANLREQCAWIHQHREAATEKSVDLVTAMVEKVKHNRSLQPIKIPVERRALVIGGGIAGIQAALDMAEAGRNVILLEKEASIGGHMSRLSETFPTLDCSQCILTPRMVEAAQHPRIRLLTWSEVESVEGYIGNFDVTIRRRARYVDEDACNGCGDCQQVCPSRKVPSEFDAGLGKRTSIYVPFPQAVPNVPVIDRASCVRFRSLDRGARKAACGKCAEACSRDAIHFDQEDVLLKERVGAIVVATGYQLYSVGREQGDPGLKGHGEYGYGELPDVIDGMQYERLVSASGPTGGELLRPSDGKVPERVVFIQCVGSRDPSRGMDYCSGICCMYVAKHVHIFHHKVHGGKATVFYMDVRATGKGYDSFSRRAMEAEGVDYMRGRVSEVVRQGEVLLVRGMDTLLGEPVEVEADLVVLATAVRPQPGVKDLARKLSVSFDKHGFLNEAHPKLRPVETATAGIFLAGACQAPRDIPDSVAMASAAAAKVLALFSKSELEREPLVARVLQETCSGCFHCERVCPFGAISHEVLQIRHGTREVALVNEGVCQGCGTCQAACPSKSVELDGVNDAQVFAAIQALGGGAW